MLIFANEHFVACYFLAIKRKWSIGKIAKWGKVRIELQTSCQFLSKSRLEGMCNLIINPLYKGLVEQDWCTKSQNGQPVYAKMDSINWLIKMFPCVYDRNNCRATITRQKSHIMSVADNFLLLKNFCKKVLQKYNVKFTNFEQVYTVYCRSMSCSIWSHSLGSKRS